MKPPVPALLVTHAGLGEGLLAAAETILGLRPDVTVLTNQGLSSTELERRIDAWLAEHDGPAVILTDLDSGSCCQAACRSARDRDDVVVLAGVNLPVLLASVRSRPQEDVLSFARHLAERGRAGVGLYLRGRSR